MSYRIQELIHKFEVGAGSHILKFFVGFIALASLAVFYDAFSFRNLTTAEGMDAAQLSRNIAEGKGYSTGFIRPFSIYLLKSKAMERAVADAGSASAPATRVSGDAAFMSKPHPDLANAPVYPVLLAAALKLNPFGHPDVTEKPGQPDFERYPPDLWIAMVNQCLLAVAAFLLFRLARKLFDEPVAWVSTIAFVGAELFWRFTLSGLSTMLLIVLFLALCSFMAALETRARAPETTSKRLVGLAFAIGVCAGLLGLTRYSFLWVFVPVLIWLIGLPGQSRFLPFMLALAGFLVVTTPWIARNMYLCNAPFGTAGFSIYQGTYYFVGDQLERSLNPDLGSTTIAALAMKLFINLRGMLISDLPRFAGSWISGFFLVGLLVPFRNPTLGRLRSFLLLTLALLLCAQASGRTWVTEDSPEINSDNLLVVLAPLVFMFGVSLFFILLTQLPLPNAGWRWTTVGLFTVIVSAPSLLGLFPPFPWAVVYPPYYPPWIQEHATNLKDQDLLMTDIPWAVAWYGKRQANIWYTLKYKADPLVRLKNDFYEVHDYVKPINGLYLSKKCMNRVDFRSMVTFLGGASTEEDWDDFLFGFFIKHQVPDGFPLKSANKGDQLKEVFLTETEQILQKTIKSSE